MEEWRKVWGTVPVTASRLRASGIVDLKATHLIMQFGKKCAVCFLFSIKLVLKNQAVLGWKNNLFTNRFILCVNTDSRFFLKKTDPKKIHFFCIVKSIRNKLDCELMVKNGSQGKALS